MRAHAFTIVDVFAEKKYAGNQLAVFRDAGDLSDEEMQLFTKEMNYSETTFILSDKKRKGGYDVRIFTPAEEIPFAGHPTLGTAFVIQQEIIRKPIEKVILNLRIGQIPVALSFSKGEVDDLWMEQKQPEFGPELDKAIIAKALSIEETDIHDKFPVQEVSTGLPFMIVPLKTLEAVKKARINRDVFFGLIADTEAKAPLIFCPETYNPKNDLNCRVFVDYYDIPEDPATGSANGCLAGYLVRHRYFGENRINVRVEQGYEIGRPSLLYLKAEENADAIDVFVGGKVFNIAKGEFI
ncbi:MAG: PhzF family phenazine biosynthesis protein [Candidatus Aminicenantes bacterium]|nr:PhzF family phenazine biosynthesis protein [Candidatus Aminicenantes bacterium]